MSASNTHDQDITLTGVWTFIKHHLHDPTTLGHRADVRVVRKDCTVTISLSPFMGQVPDNCRDQAFTFCTSLPSWAVPFSQVDGSVVVATNGKRTCGCCMIDKLSNSDHLSLKNQIYLIPFNGSWGELGGILSQTSFTYTLDLMYLHIKGLQ